MKITIRLHQKDYIMSYQFKTTLKENGKHLIQLIVPFKIEGKTVEIELDILDNALFQYEKVCFGMEPKRGIFYEDPVVNSMTKEDVVLYYNPHNLEIPEALDELCLSNGKNMIEIREYLIHEKGINNIINELVNF